ncbi:MAG: DUF2971 domain-containing protein [Actinobacteria bacterium]|nr:DUF2971 domain-containing protein [Actinomycetota bacterium]
MDKPTLDAAALLEPVEGGQYPIAPEESGVAWHYTDAQGFLGIVQSHQLWATASLALNDTSEVRYGEEIIKDVWRLADKGNLSLTCVEFAQHVLNFEFAEFAAAGLFVLSASLDEDLLSQWRNYAGTDGFSLGIDMGVPLSILNLSSVEPAVERFDVVLGSDDPTMPSIEPQWARVIYEESQQLQLAVRVVKFAVQTAQQKSGGLPEGTFGPGNWEDDVMSARSMMLHAAALLKHPAFVDEREVRFVCGKKYAGNVENYRVRDGRLVPYVGVAANRDGDSKWASDGSEPLPLVKVRYGPSSESRGLQVATDLLERNGYDSLEVRQSRIPIAN